MPRFARPVTRRTTIKCIYITDIEYTFHGISNNPHSLIAHFSPNLNELFVVSSVSITWKYTTSMTQHKAPSYSLCNCVYKLWSWIHPQPCFVLFWKQHFDERIYKVSIKCVYDWSVSGAVKRDDKGHFVVSECVKIANGWSYLEVFNLFA